MTRLDGTRLITTAGYKNQNLTRMAVRRNTKCFDLKKPLVRNFATFRENHLQKCLIRRASGPKACGIQSLGGIFDTYSHDYKGPARGHLASNLVGSISTRRPLKSSNTLGFILILPFVVAGTDQPFCTCVMCCERFGCTSVKRERFLHFQKVCDFNT